MHKSYIYALGSRWMTPLYDPLVALLMPEKQMRAAVVERLVGIESVLDVGCGTGTLAVAIKRQNRGCRVVGIDGDAGILNIARRKAQKKGLAIELQVTDAAALPFENATFDAVVSSMMFHHLPPDTKRSCLNECARVLKPGGRILLMDFGLPANAIAAATTRFMHLSDHLHATEDNLQGKIPSLLMEARFFDVREVWMRNTLFGTVRMYEARMP